jgi:hypothetical protein
MIGYVPTAQQLAEGGYEAEGSCPYFGLPGPFDPRIEGLIRRAIDELVAGQAARPVEEVSLDG